MKKIVSLILLLLSLSLVGCKNGEKPPVETEKPTFPTTEASISDYENDETIYVKLNKNGDIESIKSVIHVENVKKDTYLTYKGQFLLNGNSNLSNILNLKVENQLIKAPVLADDQNYFFEVSLDKAHYTMPFSFEIIYKLDDNIVSYQDILNKSGDITIHFNVTSNYESPYLAQIQLPINIENNKIISKEGANASVLVGKTNTLAYMVMPNTSANYTIQLESKKFSLDQVQIALQEFDLMSALPIDMSMFSDIEKLPQAVSFVKTAITSLKGLDSFFDELHPGIKQTFDSMVTMEAMLGLGDQFSEELMGALLAPATITHNEQTQVIMPHIQAIPPQLKNVQSAVSALGAYIATHKPNIEVYKATMDAYEVPYQALDNMIVSINTIEQITTMIASQTGDIESIVENKDTLKQALGLLEYSVLALQIDNLSLIKAFETYEYDLSKLMTYVVEYIDLVINLHDELTDLNKKFENYLEALKQILTHVIPEEQPIIYKAIAILEGVENDPEKIGLIKTIGGVLSQIDKASLTANKAHMALLLSENGLVKNGPLSAFITINMALSLPTDEQTPSFYSGLQKLINIKEFLDLIPEKMPIKSFLDEDNPKPSSVQFVIIY